LPTPDEHQEYSDPFASHEVIQRSSGGLVSDTQGKVESVFDRRVWEAAAVQCHPMVNTATLVITHENLQKFMAATNHICRIMDVPERAS